MRPLKKEEREGRRTMKLDGLMKAVVCLLVILLGL